MAIELKAGYETEDIRLDRIPQFDEASREYPVRRLTDKDHGWPKTWWVGYWLDQGRTDGCVGYGLTHELLASPNRRASKIRELYGTKSIADLESFAHDVVYHNAQHRDPWEGCYLGPDCYIEPSSYEYGGTSTLAGLQTLRELGLIKNYYWAFGEQDLWVSLPQVGPAVVGTWWTSGMDNVDAEGFITPTGHDRGGHLYVVYRTRFDPHHYTIWNTWRYWGYKFTGTANIKREHMAELLERQGEAAFVVV